ncbi:hypothetical protein [Streptomyces sp. NPDC007088]|uniref:hypothetical protein n=1 Tax=Streptomyces sp. NPDC007088 TaxID=3364773 RepID=UPI003677B342
MGRGRLGREAAAPGESGPRQPRRPGVLARDDVADARDVLVPAVRHHATPARYARRLR